MNNERGPRSNHRQCLICGQRFRYQEREPIVDIKQGRIRGKAHLSCSQRVQKEQSRRLPNVPGRSGSS